jgi:large subunit ribosomal protein L4
MAKINVVNVLGQQVSEINLADDVFAIEPHNQSMFDLVLSERASLRQGTHKTKTRTEVSGGGRKP